MTISKDLFLALLSMDVYNRGYGQGVGGLQSEGALLGNAKIIRQSDIDPGSPGVDAGFYAVAYKTTKDIGAKETGGVIPGLRPDLLPPGEGLRRRQPHPA